jgi:hypothetical protein
MKKLLFLLVFPLFLLSCEGAGQLGNFILNETKKCDEYHVKYHSTNNCNDVIPNIVYLTSEEYQRLYNLVSNALPLECVSVTITPKDGSQLKIGYIKNLESLIKITKNNGVPCN